MAKTIKYTKNALGIANRERGKVQFKRRDGAVIYIDARGVMRRNGAEDATAFAKGSGPYTVVERSAYDKLVDEAPLIVRPWLERARKFMAPSATE